MSTYTAARFWRCDLQVHSPLEPEFSPGIPAGDMKALTQAAERLVAASLAVGLDVIAVTDHNSAEFIPAVQDASRETGLHVFPGVEVSASDGYHLLGLFDPNTSKTTIDNFLTKIGFEAGQRRWPDNAVRIADAPWTLAEIVAEASERGAICIAPHVRRDKGLLDKAMANDIRVRNWQCADLLAVEDDRIELVRGSFEDDCLLNERDTYKREHPFARVWGSDAKTYDSVGKESTLIKMVQPTIEGLRQAFLDPGSRIRHPETYEPTNRDRFRSISWDGGFFDGESIAFSEQLNCLIGGKGAGKSTTIESLRYVFGFPLSFADLSKQHSELVNHSLPPGTRVSVAVERKDGAVFTISRSVGGAVEVRDSADQVVRVDPSDVLEFEIFSQGEILETARSAAAQLQLIDDFAVAELGPLQAEEADIVRRLSDSRSRLSAAAAQQEQSFEDRARIERLEEARKAFDQKGVANRTALRRDLDREATLLADAKTRLGAQRTLIEQLEGLGVPPALFSDADIPHASIFKSVAQELEKLHGKALEVRATLLAQFDSVVAQLLNDTSGDSEYLRQTATKREEVAGVYRELQEEFPDLDLAFFERIDKELEDLRLRVEPADEASGQLQILRSARDTLLAELAENRRKQFKLRDSVAARLNKQLNGAVRVTVSHQGQRAAFAEYLASFKTKTRTDVLESLVEPIDRTPQALGTLLIAGPETLASSTSLTTPQAAALSERLDLAQKMLIEEFRVPDSVEVELNIADDGESPNYRDLSRLSVGQKATTVLLLLLASGTSPLVIDQPENDLDNRFIVKDVVERIRSAKDSRQLVLATHNANIPVLGDAEVIAVLDSDEVGGRSRGRFEFVGSIDLRVIKEKVNQILEGGRDAFRLRQEKYGVPE